MPRFLKNLVVRRPWRRLGPWLAAAVLALALGAGVSPGRAADAPALTVLAAGDLRGEIEPCGCSPEGQFGGLRRRLSYLRKALAKQPAPLLVDLGNNFPEATAQGRHKIALIRKLMLRYPPQAVLPGPGELALEPAALNRGLPYVLSNDGARSPFPPVRRAASAGLRVGIYGYLSPAAVYQGAHTGLHLRAVDDALLGRLRRNVRNDRNDVTLLLFRGDDAELAAFVRAGLFDLIVTGNPSADELKQVTERKVAGARVPQVLTKGQGLLRLRLRPGAAAAPDVRVDWLSKDWPDDPDAAPVFAAYDEHVKALFFARLQTLERHRQESPYAGAETCTPCHAAAAQAWQASRHSHALATLARVGKQHDPECLACHVLGLERGGYLSEDLTPQFANVQCESCHGPARTHVGNPAQKPAPVPVAQGAPPARPGEGTCRTCHRGSHSPHFDFAVYWPKIAHKAPATSAQR